MRNRHFIIAGAQRSGTTHLYRLLEQHPQICMATPVRPEPKYFIGSDRSPDYRDYLAKHFPHRLEGQVLGEKSTSYIERLDCIPRIKQLLPGVHVIFLLRDPIQRAYSNWKFSREHGIEPLEFLEALLAEEERINRSDDMGFSVSPFAYASRGEYSRYLHRWLEHFDRGQITVMLSERLFADHQSVNALFDRLGLPNHTVDELGKVNATEGAQAGIPTQAERLLRERYSNDINALKSDWGLDVTPWK